MAGWWRSHHNMTTNRFRAPRSGRWNAHACAARKAVNVKQMSLCFVQKPELVSVNSGRWVC